MNPLRKNTSADAVIPLLAQTFGDVEELEDAVLGALSSAVLDTDEWRLLEDAVEMGYLGSEEIDAEFADFLSEELSRSSCDELQGVDREILQAAGLGDAGCLWFLSIRLTHAAICAVDSAEKAELRNDSLLLLAEAAEAGEPRAQWILGERFSRMRDGLDEGLRLLGMAADQGSGPALSRLMQLFDQRESSNNPRFETKSLLKFARAGLTEAQFELANHLYLRGELSDAFAWMLKAAQAGHRGAQERIAFFYDVGDGCSRNPERANYWRSLEGQPVESLMQTAVESDSIQKAEEAPLKTPTEIAVEETILFAESIVEENVDVQDPESKVAGEEECSLDERQDGDDEEIDGEYDERQTAAYANEDDQDEQHFDCDEEQRIAEECEQREEAISPNVPQVGLFSRFRLGLARVLRRLADRVLGSGPSRDDR